MVFLSLDYLFFFFSCFASFFSLAVFCGFFFSDFLVSIDLDMSFSSRAQANNLVKNIIYGHRIQ